MFRFTQETSSGSKRQYLLKLQIWSDGACPYECGSIMAAYWACCACLRVLYRAGRDCVMTHCSVPCRKGLCYHTV
jgi:hypothetical protein